MPRIYDRFFGPEFADRRDRLIEIVRKRLPQCERGLAGAVNWLETVHSEETTRRSLKRRNAEMLRRDDGTPDAPGALLLLCGGLGEAILPGDGLRTDRVEHALVDLLRQHETPEPRSLLGRHLPKGEREDNALKAVLVCSIVLDPEAASWLAPHTDLASRQWKTNKEDQPWIRGGVELMESHGANALALLEQASSVLGWIGRSEPTPRPTPLKEAELLLRSDGSNRESVLRQIEHIAGRLAEGYLGLASLGTNLESGVRIALRAQFDSSFNSILAGTMLPLLNDLDAARRCLAAGLMIHAPDLVRADSHVNEAPIARWEASLATSIAEDLRSLATSARQLRAAARVGSNRDSVVGAIDDRSSEKPAGEPQDARLPSGQPKRRGKGGGELWRKAQKRMIDLYKQGKLPNTLRRAAAMLHVEGFTQSTVRTAAHRSPTLQAHFNLDGKDHQSSANGADIFDELTTIADTDTRRAIKGFSPQQKADLRAQLAAMPREDAVETLRTLANDPDSGGAAFCGLIEEADRDGRHRD